MEAEDLKLTARYQMKTNKQVANIRNICFGVSHITLDTVEGKRVVRTSSFGEAQSQN